MVVNSFTVNGLSSSFQNTSESFYNVLNGGNSKDNTLQYVFTLTELLGHQIEYIIIESLLFTEELSFGESTKYSLLLLKDLENLPSYSGTIVSNTDSKTPFGVKFISSSGNDETASVKLTLTVKNNSNTDSYYGLYKIIVSLRDVLEEIHYSFRGPLTNRTPTSITCLATTVIKGTLAVSFSKNPLLLYDSSKDVVEGKIYFRKDGIYIDGYQYGVNSTATSSTKGVVCLLDKFEKTNEGIIIPPNKAGVAASPQLVYEAVSLLLGGEFSKADTENYGSVKLLDDFEIDEDGGIICPTEAGIAASAVLAYNTLASAKNYVDEQTNFSDDFIRKDDSKLYIKWLTITENGDLLTY